MIILLFCFSGALTVGDCIGDSCVLTLKNVTGTTITEDQKWDFNSDGAITSLSGYTISTYDIYEPQILVVAHRSILIPNKYEIFRVVLAPV